MARDETPPVSRHRRLAGKAVLVALMLAFFGSMLGVVFGIAFGEVSGVEVWVISLVVLVTGGLLVLVSWRPTLATEAITGLLTVYFVIHLNVGAILAFEASDRLVRAIPYVTWFFPLVLFHQFTNFGFYKRSITVLVGLGPFPSALYVLTQRPEPLASGDIDAIVTYLTSFYTVVIFVGVFRRHRDEKVLSAAKAEEAERHAEMLRINEERFRLLGLATNDLIWDADLRSQLIWWNDTLLKDYGYDPKALGMDMDAWGSWVHPDDRARVEAGVRAALEGGDSNWVSEYRFMTADGRAVDVVDRGLILRDDAGAPVRMIGSTTDVSELRALERKLRHSQKMEALGQLTGGIAHDFNNVLTVIIGSVESLAEGHSGTPEAKRLAQITMQAADQGATLTSRLLAFARLQALAPRRLDPGQLLTGIEDLIRRTIKEDVEIEIRVAPDLCPIEVDPGQLENAVLNLSINARDAMPDGGRLTIEALNVTLTEDDLPYYEGMTAGRAVTIAVTDTGTGMPREVAERAFEPFFTTKEAGKGSGLGLSMVWGFVQQSNGHARISSEPGKGTSVRLCFAASCAQDEPVSAPAAARGLTGGTERILVVEDDELVRSHAVRLLGSLGYAVKEAVSPTEALALLDDGWTADLLFTDVMMPGGLNGRQLADAALIRQPGLKVLFTSGYTEDAIVHGGRLDPGVNLLGKPYRRAELAAKVRHVLDA